MGLSDVIIQSIIVHQDEPETRKAYHTPRLERLGDLRNLTLGGSPGTLDSGSGNRTEFPPGMNRMPINGAKQPKP